MWMVQSLKFGQLWAKIDRCRGSFTSKMNVGHPHPKERILISEVCNKKPYPLECIFSNIDMASIAMQATISTDILEEEIKDCIFNMHVAYKEKINK